MQKKVVITGATRGVGRALTMHFASLGCQLALCARTSTELRDLELELIKYNVDTIVKICNLADKDQINRFTQEVLSAWGSIDLLINNAGIYSEGVISQTTTKDIEQMMQVNFLGSYHLTKAFLPYFKTQKQGNIIFINSVLGREYRSNAVSYTITKQAQLTFATLLKEEMRSFGVKVTSILPGSINTSSWDGINAPKEQFVQTEDMVNAVKFILSASKYTFVEDIVIRPMDKNF